jgi:thiamine biosynthesis lipoprotein
MKRTVSVIVLTILIASLLSGCQTERKEYTRYNDNFFGAFDTITQVLGYTKTEDEFNSYVKKIESRFQELHKLYDIYSDYEGINNIKTINDNAGIEPVKVDKQIIDLIKFSKEWYNRTGGKTNIAMGSVLRIWHDYREEADRNPANAKIPPMEELLEASEHTDIDRVIVDEENSTVYLDDEKMRLDVGAVAKGYAVEVVIERSKFIGHATPVESEEEAVAFIEKIKTEYWNATHNVPAYMVGENNEIQRYSDDKEPSGTAGVPVLEVIKREDLKNVAGRGGSGPDNGGQYRKGGCYKNRFSVLWEGGHTSHRRIFK